MRWILTGFALAFIAASASAQTALDFEMCQDKDDPDLRVTGCTAIIDSGSVTAPSDLAVLFEARAMAYFEKDRYEQAAQDFTKAIEYKPGDGSIYAERGYSYEKNGQTNLAITDYRTTLKLAAPDSSEALAANARLKALGVRP